MYLRFQHKISHSNCVICRWATTAAVVWFLDMVQRPDLDNIGTFRVFIKSNGTPGLISKHEVVYICNVHWESAVKDWISVAQEELNLAIAFDAWTERVEK